MSPALIVLEGSDGSGKTTHAERLATALSMGARVARAWHHPPPRTDTSYAQRARHFADARRRFLAETVIALVARERDALPAVTTLLLDATHDALDARLVARGEVLFDARYAVRHRYWQLAVRYGWPTVMTDDDADTVSARLVAHLLRARVLAPPREGA